MPVDKLEFWSIFVFESPTPYYQVDQSPDIFDGPLWLVNMMDLQGIFTFLPSALSLVKYLRNDKEVQNKLQLSSVDYLDRFAYYFANNESYPIMAFPASAMITFASHEWHYFYHERLFEKFQDNIYELIEHEFPDRFNYVEKYHDNLYEVIDTEAFDGGRVFKYAEHLIWIMYPPNNIDNTEEEIRVSIGLLAPLYAYYVSKIWEPLLELLRKHDLYLQSRYRVAIYPASYVKRKKHYEYLQGYVFQLCKDKPLIVVTHRISESLNICSCVVYDDKYLEALFAPQKNVGERFCISQLIGSLIDFLAKNMAEDELQHITQRFLDENIPVRSKGYSFEKVRIENPKLSEYGNYQKLSETDIAKVNQEIAEFLSEQQVMPGEYYGEEAKLLNNQIFQFLQKKLEKELCQYNQQALFYAYRQIELIEGQHAKTRIKVGKDASKYTEYDFVQGHLEAMTQMSDVRNSSKYIVETMLKVGVNGEKAMNHESWQYLLAMALVLHDTTIISDYIHFGIVEYGLRITDVYRIEDLRGEEAFNIREFYQAENAQQIEHAKQLFIKDERVTANDNTDHFIGFFQELSSAFEVQFGFSLTNLFAVLRLLGVMDLFSEEHFPLSIVPNVTLIQTLNKNTRESLDETIIQKVLDFVSLNFYTYTPDEELIPAQLLLRKERLNVCPIIQLETGDYLYGNQFCFHVTQSWLNLLISANFPYLLPKDSPVKEVLLKLHNFLDHEFEKEAANIATLAIGEENIEATIDNFKRLSDSFPAKPDCGEIDLLAVNKATKILYVLDAKNRNRRMRVYDIELEMREFFTSRKSYLNQLSKKEKFLQDHLDEVLQHFSIEGSEGWQIRKGFIVNTNYPSAYRIDQAVDFIFVDDLADYLLQ
jgi:hypothetical protein